MLKMMRQRLSQEEGFTLIELMVVVLIIAVLVAIAIPSFLGFRNSAQDRAAQTALRNTLLAQKATWTDSSAYTSNATTLAGYEPSIVIGTGVNEVNIVNAVATETCMESESASGKFFGIYQPSTGGTQYGVHTAAGLCPASGAPSTGTWQTASFPSG